jgi:hypothetical protein
MGMANPGMGSLQIVMPQPPWVAHPGQLCFIALHFGPIAGNLSTLWSATTDRLACHTI